MTWGDLFCGGGKPLAGIFLQRVKKERGQGKEFKASPYLDENSRALCQGALSSNGGDALSFDKGLDSSLRWNDGVESGVEMAVCG